MHKGKIWQNCMQSFHRFIDLNVSVSSVASTFLSRTLFMWFLNVSHMFFTFQGRWCGTAAQRCLCRATPSPTAYCHWHHSWLWERRQRWRHCHWWQRVVAKFREFPHVSTNTLLATSLRFLNAVTCRHLRPCSWLLTLESAELRGMSSTQKLEELSLAKREFPKTHLHLLQGSQINSTSSASSKLSPETESGPSLEPSLMQDSLENYQPPMNSRNRSKCKVDIVQLSEMPPAAKLARFGWLDVASTIFRNEWEKLSLSRRRLTAFFWTHLVCTSLRFTSSHFVLQSFPCILAIFWDHTRKFYIYCNTVI